MASYLIKGKNAIRVLGVMERAALIEQLQEEMDLDARG